MKIKYLFAPLAAMMFVATSCVGDLDVQPLDKTIVTGKEAYSDAASYEKALMKIYSVWALSGQEGEGSSDIEGLDPGNTQLLRSWWILQVNTTDECKNAWPDAWVNEINGMMWTTTQCEPIEAVYQRSMYIVALVNEYMKNIGDAPAEVKKEQFAAEARYNRAFAYYVLLDQFGIPPFITENNYNINPSAKSRAELFNWIEGELKEIVNVLPAARQGTYGRADQGVVNALLARMYLNAAVYTGTERYSDCIAACKEVIAGGYKLAEDYSNLFKADNGQNPDTRNEIIYPICFDGDATKSYGGTNMLLFASRGSKEYDTSRDGINGGWDGFRATQSLVNLFEFYDPQNKDAETIADGRGIFYSQGRTVDISTTCIGTFTSEGWAVYKYKNVKSDGTPGSNTSWVDVDFPIFRLADIYLMYAEAVARGGQGGDITTAVGYINELRDRAFWQDPNYHVSETWLKANNFRNILDERARELYWEGTRRTDLIRYGLYTSGSYVWPDKGGVITGVGVNDRYNIFPIPVTDLTVNTNLHQNSGY